MAHSAVTKANLSAMRKGDKNPFYGKRHTAAFRLAQSERTKQMNASRQYEIGARTFGDITATEAAYLAGLVDGDGSITMPGGRKGISITVYNTDAELAGWLQSWSAKICSVRMPRSNDVVRGNKPMYAWIVYGARDLWYLLNAMMPFLIIKKCKAELAINFLREKYGEHLDGK